MSISVRRKHITVIMCCFYTLNARSVLFHLSSRCSLKWKIYYFHKLMMGEHLLGLSATLKIVFAHQSLLNYVSPKQLIICHRKQQIFVLWNKMFPCQNTSKSQWLRIHSASMIPMSRKYLWMPHNMNCQFLFSPLT